MSEPREWRKALRFSALQLLKGEREKGVLGVFGAPRKEYVDARIASGQGVVRVVFSERRHEADRLAKEP
jgi:hypothetical protein